MPWHPTPTHNAPQPVNTFSLGTCPWYVLGLIPKIITFHFPSEATAFAFADRETLVKSVPETECLVSSADGSDNNTPYLLKVYIYTKHHSKYFHLVTAVSPPHKPRRGGLVDGQQARRG